MPSWYSSHPPLTWAQTQGLRAKLDFSAVSILHVHSRVCVQWQGRGGGAQIMQSVVLCAANGQDGANAVAQTPCACNYMSRSLPGFSRREGPSAVPTAWVCAAGVQRVRSRPAWRLALTRESRADIARFIYKSRWVRWVGGLAVWFCVSQCALSDARGAVHLAFFSCFGDIFVSACLHRPHFAFGTFGVCVCVSFSRTHHSSAARARQGAGVYHSRPLSGLPGRRSGRAGKYRGTCPTPILPTHRPRRAPSPSRRSPHGAGGRR